MGMEKWCKWPHVLFHQPDAVVHVDEEVGET